MTPAVAPAIDAPEPAPENALLAFAKRGIRNLVVCLLIALLMWSFDPDKPGSFVINLVYSVSIGTFCWFFVDGGRLLVARAIDQLSAQPQTPCRRWPGPAWMVVCILAGVLLGYYVGGAIGDAVSGHRLPSLVENRSAVLICLLAAIAGTFYFYANERLHEEREAAEAARRLATESQLRLLESQLEPHMLFNTLANLRALIGVDPHQAQAMLDRLIAFLRATLRASRSGLHPLAAEFERLADYLALMAVRMGPRLTVQLDLPDALRQQPVPPLLLQPLVENAIRHGLEPNLGGGRLEVSARRDGDELVLVVRDTGVGVVAPTAETSGQYGLTHVSERLAATYGTRGRFDLAPAADGLGGTRAELRLPLDETDKGP